MSFTETFWKCLITCSNTRKKTSSAGTNSWVILSQCWSAEYLWVTNTSSNVVKKLIVCIWFSRAAFPFHSEKRSTMSFSSFTRAITLETIRFCSNSAPQRHTQCLVMSRFSHTVLRQTNSKIWCVCSPTPSTASFQSQLIAEQNSEESEKFSRCIQVLLTRISWTALPTRAPLTSWSSVVI